MKTLLLAGFALAAVVASGPVLASTVPAATAPKARAAPAKAVSRAEMTQKVQQHFARLDSDRDGFISKAEADSASHSRRAHRTQRVEMRGTAIFDRLDTNKDGIVTRLEAEPFFASGQVDIAHSGPGDAQPRRDGDALVSRHDSNRDGSITRAEFEAGRAQHAQNVARRRQSAGMRHPGLGGRMFETADANKDGRVSLAEASSAASAHFDAADTNRDGIVSPVEMRQARKVLAPESGRRR